MDLADLQAVASGKTRVALSNNETWRQKLRDGRRRLELDLDQGDAVYGVSTGVGYTSSNAVDRDHTHEFAYQIIRQHGCGLGPPFDKVESRAILFARLVSLAKGFSAVRPSLLQALCDLLNHDLVPVIPQLGSVGASGDLTPLSYVAAVLAGEREVFTEDGIQPTSAALKKAGLRPHHFAPKESLAVMNGTAVMTAVGALIVQRLDAVLSLCERTTALAVEVLLGRTQAFHPTAHRLKNHPGQIQAAGAIARALEGSGLTDGDDQAPRMVQDPYSLRCAPHVIGAARDALDWSARLIGHELNSVNDNPIVDPASGETIFAGNFYGGHLALSMDLLKIAVASVADLLDRQFALLVDSRLNCALPETLVNYGGCGTKALQLTCSALTARTVQRSGSDTVTSRSTEAHNQDKVSMGLNAALNAAEAVDLLRQIVAVLMVALSNAAALRGEDKFSAAGKELLCRIREISPVLEFDRRLDQDLNRLTAAIADGLI
jgi:histidine ammonia-lyase